MSSCYLRIKYRDDWWSTQPISMDKGALFHLNEFMSNEHFNAIMTALKCTDREPPVLFIHHFHEVRLMINAFNDHYEDYSLEYLPSWLSCLDKSMNRWLNKFCPGFVSLPRKPKPSGNEYHLNC